MSQVPNGVPNGNNSTQSKYWIFTRFSAHGSLDHQEIEQVLEPLCSYAVYQTEVSPATGREHIQGYIILKNRTRSTTLVRTFPSHLEVRRGTHEQAVNYCSKEESRKQGTQPHFIGTPPPASRHGQREDLKEFKNAIMEGKTNWELIDEFPREMAKFPRFVNLCRQAKQQKAVESEYVNFTPRIGWQFELAQVLAAPPSNRKVLWRYETQGNVGKSYFALNYKPKETFIVTGGKHADIHYSYNFEKYVFFDWSRSTEGSFPYGLVEQFKNGYFLSTKYESVPKRFGTPHVVVFANFAPDETQMSADRWDTRNLRNQ